jgi:hypothetical protein
VEDVVATVIVADAPAATVCGENVTVVPAGTPDADSATLCVTPLTTAVLIVLVAACPAVSDSEDGDALSEKSFAVGRTTVSATAVVRVTEAPVPVTTSDEVPAGVVDVVVTVIVDEPPAATDCGEKLTVAPAGAPDADRVTVCVVPLVTAVLIVLVPTCPAFTDSAEGEALMEKSFVDGVLVWHARLPLSVQVFPASGWNRQS